MIDDNLNFEIIPYFYINCLYTTNELISDLKEDLKKYLEKLGAEISSISLQNLDLFSYRGFSRLGCIKIELKRLELPAPEPSTLFDISRGIEDFCTEYNKIKSKVILLDDVYHPYSINIGTKVSRPDDINSKEIIWTKDNILRFKKSLGKWIEFYSGQWSDYSEELFISRVENNISNRLSELHFIRTNSAFIFISESGLEKFMPYMDEFFINQTLRVRSLLFCYFILNKEIDNINHRFPELKKSPLKQIETEIGRVEDLERFIQELSSRVFSERIINRRSHSKKVLDTCYDIFQIELVSSTIEKKINNLQETLASERAKNQKRLSDQQRQWISILTVLFGSQTLFTMKDRLAPILNLDPDDPFLETIEIGIWCLIIVAVVIILLLLIITWFKSKYGFKRV